VGSGFCPTVRGLPRTMLAPDASVGNVKKVMFVYQSIELTIDYSVLDIQSPYPLLFFFAFRGIIISTDPKQKGMRRFHMTIGKNIADLRKNSGMTQEQLAETLGVSSQTISKWENEVTMPDIMLLPVIAGCFDIAVDELYHGRKSKKKQNAVDYDEIPEMLYDSLIDLTQRGWVDTVEGKDIETEKEKMKSYLAENRQVKTATFSNKRGAVIATSEIGLLHRGKANADQLVQEGIGRVLEVLSNTAVRRVFAYEMDNMNKPITAPYVAKKCDISPDEAAEALELLTEIHVNHLTEVMLDENNSVRMYALNSDECIMYVLMILKTARLIDENKQHYFNYRGSYNNLWIQ
jgi:transcriptional regulator with XRE-family HTH domain